MSDEQTELLKQILEVQKESLALTKQYREEVKATNEAALSGQRQSLRMSRIAIVVLVVALGILVVGYLARRSREGDRAPSSAPSQVAPN